MLNVRPMKTLILTALLLASLNTLARTSDRIDRAALQALETRNYDTSRAIHTLYGYPINHEDVNYGYLACARVVAAVLTAADIFVPRLHPETGEETRNLALAVFEVERKLSRLGWKKILREEELLPGDVVVWRGVRNDIPPYRCSGGGNCHVGIVTSQGTFHNNFAEARPNFDITPLAGTFVFKMGYRAPY